MCVSPCVCPQRSLGAKHAEIEGLGAFSSGPRARLGKRLLLTYGTARVPCLLAMGEEDEKNHPSSVVPLHADAPSRHPSSAVGGAAGL